MELVTVGTLKPLRPGLLQSCTGGSSMQSCVLAFIQQFGLGIGPSYWVGSCVKNGNSDFLTCVSGAQETCICLCHILSLICLCNLGITQFSLLRLDHAPDRVSTSPNNQGLDVNVLSSCFGALQVAIQQTICHAQAVAAIRAIEHYQKVEQKPF